MSAAGNPLQPALDAIAARLAADAQRIAELEAELLLRLHDMRFWHTSCRNGDPIHIRDVVALKKAAP